MKIGDVDPVAAVFAGGALVIAFITVLAAVASKVWRRIAVSVTGVCLLAAAVLATIAILRSSEDSAAAPAPASQTPPVTAGPASTTGPAAPSTSGAGGTSGAMFIFDDLGGGLPTIKVYPGPSDSAADHAFNGVFRNGEQVPALCMTVGRSLPSVPADGERPRTSTTWIRIAGSPGLTQYASLTYGEVRPSTSSLPAC